jgi:DNA-3-methyladenine glycosylase
MSRPLPRTFFTRPTVEVARDLLGCRLHRMVDGQERIARVVETEAYCGVEDLACHASKGLTARTRPMFGPAGHAYVYFIYGMHHCLNVVTEGGRGAAVLFRAVEPLAGVPEGRKTSGPGLLTKALSIDKALDAHDLTAGRELWLEAGEGPAGPVEAGPRIGVAYAGPWAERPWRFWIRGSPWVSTRPRRGGSGVVQGEPARRPATAGRRGR